MCGIAGAVWISPPGKSHVEEAVSRSIAAMHNRGPDSAGHVLWEVTSSNTVVALGSTRLAVQDLSPAGRQPMSTPDGRFTLIYNGEITNFIELRLELRSKGVEFRSEGDTELLLRAWESWQEDALLRVEGMYAFAILDRGERTLTLCRDPFGIKPLYHFQPRAGGVAFGSEISSILPLIDGGPRLNWRTAVDYLASGAYDGSPDTFIEGIGHLPPGHLLVIDLDTGRCTMRGSSWRPSIQTDNSIRFSDAVDGVRSLFLDSVRRNLRADVPVGLALSGGVDSSAIVCATRILEPDYPIAAFSFLSTDVLENESAWIKKIADQSAATCYSVEPQPSDLAKDLDDLILCQGEPFGSTGIYAGYRLFRLMRDQGIVVSLDGQGADELFAGYHGYLGPRTRSLLETRQFKETLSYLAAWPAWPGRSPRSAIAHLGVEFAPSWLLNSAFRRVPGSTPPGLLRRALDDRGLAWRLAGTPGDRTMDRGLRVKAELRAALTNGGLQQLLRHSDRNSMRFSVESRVPYLDRRLADFVLSLPESFLVDRHGRTKVVLREAMRGIVPDEILDRRDKIGFAAPVAAWVDAQRGTFGEKVAEAPPIGFLDKAQVLSALDPVRFAGRNPPRRLGADLAWRLFNLYRWAALYGVDCEN